MRLTRGASAWSVGLVLALTLGGAFVRAQGGEGIQVHGDWVIDIRNPDGSLASHREIKNGLSTAPNQGASMLALLLGRRYIAGGWQMEIGKPGQLGVADGPCTAFLFGSFNYPCLIVEPRPGISSSQSIFLTLQPSLPEQGGLLTGSVQLNGYATATHDSSFDRVATKLVLCDAQTATTASCFSAATTPLSGNGTEFTTKTFSPPIQVASGQQIQVQVTFSFASATVQPAPTTNP